MTDEPLSHFFAPRPPRDWPPDLDDLRNGYASGLNVYGVMAHHPPLLRAWQTMREHVVLNNALGPVLTEVVILRSAFHLGSRYEWNHHVLRARDTGLDDARIASFRGDPSQMSADDAYICRAVDDLFAARALSPGVARSLVALVGREGTLDLIATVGFYSTLAYMLNSFDTPLDSAAQSRIDAAPLATAPPPGNGV